MVKVPVNHGEEAELSPELPGDPPTGSQTGAHMFTRF